MYYRKLSDLFRCKVHHACRLISILLFAYIAIGAPKPRILVLTEIAGWDHGTRAVANSVIRDLGILHGFDVDTTNVTDGFFTDSSLAGYSAVCFINTTGTIFTTAEADAFKRYMRAGGGYVGMHASTDGEYSLQWYGEMTGAFFNGHPFNVATAKVAVLDKKHPSTEFITSDTLTRTDEWYFWGQNPDFRNNPLIDPAENDSVNVLMTLVESSIPGSTLNHFHPICWYRNFENGRVWYCGLGHDPGTFNDSLVKRMLLGGIRYAAGMTTMRTSRRASIPKPPRLAAGVCNLSVYDIRGRVVQASTAIAGTRAPVEQLWDRRDNNGCPVGAGHYLLILSQETMRIVKPITFGH